MTPAEVNDIHMTGALLLGMIGAFMVMLLVVPIIVDVRRARRERAKRHWDDVLK